MNLKWYENKVFCTCFFHESTNIKSFSEMWIIITLSCDKGNTKMVNLVTYVFPIVAWCYESLLALSLKFIINSNFLIQVFSFSKFFFNFITSIKTMKDVWTQKILMLSNQQNSCYFVACVGVSTYLLRSPVINRANKVLKFIFNNQ